MRNHSALATRVLRIFIGRIERELRRSAAAPAHARLGAASFLQRVGSALNEHWHHHCCLSDSVFAAATSQSLAFVFAAVGSDREARVQARVRLRVLAAYCRHGVLDEGAAADMADREHEGGFPVDSSCAIARQRASAKP